MNLLSRILSPRTATRSASQPTSWDHLAGRVADGDVAVPPPLAENMSAVFAAVQIISETVASLPLMVYREDDQGVRTATRQHPVSRIFAGDANDWQTAPEWIETMTAHCLLRGNAYAEIVRDNRGAPVALVPFHPDHVRVVQIPESGRLRYEVTTPHRGTRRLLADEVLHLKDRSDDGILGKSRLHRARETFQTAMAVERFAGSTYRNGAALSGVVTHPDQIGPEAAKTLRESIEALYRGSSNAGRIGVFEEGMSWTALSVSPEDAQMLESRRFSIEQIARMFRIPPPVLGDLSNGSYSNVTELGRWFAGHTIRPWLVKWERTIERALFSTEGRRVHHVEFDMDELLRGDMLTRFQAYRIAREIGVYNANELRGFERQNPRTDDEADTYLSPMNMQPEQKGEPKE